MKAHRWTATLAAAFLYAIVPGAQPSHAADHRDGDAAKDDPTADISDVFAFPVVDAEGAPRLVLAMSVHPYAGDEASFSDAVDYVFRLRPAKISGTGAATAIETGADETRIRCRLETAGEPHMACDASGPACGDACPSATVKIGDASASAEEGLRVFAGLRSDPFFSDVARVRAPRLRDIDLNTPGINTFGLANVLVLVTEFDVQDVLGPVEAGATFAVVAETLITEGDQP